jgi:phage-related protein
MKIGQIDPEIVSKVDAATNDQEEIKKDQKAIEESKTELKGLKEEGKKEIAAAMDKAEKEFEEHKAEKILKKELKK